MKISEAKQAYSAQMNRLWDQKRALTKLLEEGEAGGPAGNFDRVEISRELSQVEAQYEATRAGMEKIQARETAIHNSESAKQQSEAAAEAADEFSKIMEIYRRIASGGQVPPRDENKLMEYDAKLYMMAKTAALIAKEKGEKYDSLWEEEEEGQEEKPSPSEIAANTEISVPAPEVVAQAATAEAQ